MHTVSQVLTPVMCATGLSKTFNATRALRDVSIEVQPGEMRALVGRNGAGKSTLVSILTGLLPPDAGTIEFSGTDAPAPHERELWQTKVACVYQHSKVIPTLSCAENLFISRTVRQRGLISWKRMRHEAREVMEEWGLDIDADAPASALSVGQRQLLEIARALSQGSRFLILDEPTAKLDSREADRLLDRLRVLRERGVGVLFISHHLDEIFDVCQSVTVLRDGRKTLDRPLAALARSELIDAMVGSAKTATASRAPAAIDRGAAPPRLVVRSLGCGKFFEAVSFEARAGECVGIAGLAGSGKEAIGEVLAGLRPRQSGSIHLDGVELSAGDVADHIRAGIGFVPQDRHREGLVLGMSVEENATMTVTDRLGAFGFIRPATLARRAAEMIEALDIKVSRPSAPVSELSGGNQQKVVLARALARAPRVLVLINPTCGVDVASKAALFGSISEVAKRGTAVIVISDELDELELCHRVLVVRSHRLTKEFVLPCPHHSIVAEMEGVAA